MKLILISFLFIPYFSFTQQIIEVKNKAKYPFLLSLPEQAILDSIPPIIIFLHGRSLSGNNLDLVRKYGVIDAVERGRKIPAIVIAPQVDSGSSWDPPKILSVLEYVQENYQTDANRVYVTGMSLGGYGTTYFAGTYPEKIAAAVALCGGGKISDACNLTKTNIWIQHGKLDEAVAHTESVKMYEAIKACDSDAICYFTSYPNADHGDLASEFYRDEIYDWMFQFALNQDSKKMDQLKIESSKTFSKKGVVYGNVKSKNKTSKNNEIIDKELNTESSINKRDKIITYTVKKGDTLIKIAKKYTTTVAEIQRINKLKTTTIQINQILKIK
jgi:LysM repeat protein/pimeloyl-ACP methyl ester carboxylesterase